MNAGEHSWVVSANIAGLLGMENLLCVVYRCYYCWSHSQSPHWLNTIHRNTSFPSRYEPILAQPTTKMQPCRLCKCITLAGWFSQFPTTLFTLAVVSGCALR